MLPPYGYIVEAECSSEEMRDDMIDAFTDAGIFVMDPGDSSQPLYVNCESLDEVRSVIEAKSFLRNTKSQYIHITVRSE